MESWVCLVETVLFFFSFNDQYSKHDFVLQDCGRGGELPMCCSDGGRLEILFGEFDQKILCASLSELTHSPAYSRNSEMHEDVILVSFYCAHVECLSDCAVKYITFERFFPDVGRIKGKDGGRTEAAEMAKQGMWPLAFCFEWFGGSAVFVRIHLQ